MFMGQTYQGSSFFEMLRTDHPTLLPDFGHVEELLRQSPTVADLVRNLTT